MRRIEQYTSGSGKVESYKKDKTEDHDEIVLRLKDGRRVVISNNTKLGIRVEPKEGDEVNYHGYGVKGTNVVHKVHPNKSSRGGWLEHVKKAASNDDILSMARRHYPAEGSHGWNHIEDVMASARRMRRRELLKKELAALAYHDSSLMTGPRETHAEDSAAIAGEELRKLFRKEQLKDIMNAIAHHRASYEGRRASRLEDLVAAADRDMPDVDKYILRSYQWGMEHGMTPDEAVDNTFHHMPDKYGTKGYAYKNVPKIYMDTYGDEVRKAQVGFDNVTPEQIKALAAGLNKKN